MHARELPPAHGSPRAVHGQGSGRGRNTRGAALNSTSSECSVLWLAKYNKSRVNRPAFKAFQDLENFYFKFQDFSDFCRICMKRST